MEEIKYHCIACQEDREPGDRGFLYPSEYRPNTLKCNKCSVHHRNDNVICDNCHSQTIIISYIHSIFSLNEMLESICSDINCLKSRMIRCKINCKYKSKCSKRLYPLNGTINHKVAYINFDRSCIVINNTSNNKKPYDRYTTPKGYYQDDYHYRVKRYLLIRKQMLELGL